MCENVCRAAHMSSKKPLTVDTANVLTWAKNENALGIGDSTAGGGSDEDITSLGSRPVPLGVIGSLSNRSGTATVHFKAAAYRSARYKLLLDGRPSEFVSRMTIVLLLLSVIPPFVMYISDPVPDRRNDLPTGGSTGKGLFEITEGSGGVTASLGGGSGGGTLDSNSVSSKVKLLEYEQQA